MGGFVGHTQKANAAPHMDGARLNWSLIVTTFIEEYEERCPSLAIRCFL